MKRSPQPVLEIRIFENNDTCLNIYICGRKKSEMHGERKSMSMENQSVTEKLDLVISDRWIYNMRMCGPSREAAVGTYLCK